MKAWRVYLKKTQKEVAEALGITQGAYSQIENAESNQKGTLEKVGRVLGLEVGQLTLDD
ncbi:helix-turn-helix domain-containing protein [Victivallis vadensis]|uniref:helix-turn-helix domain-containing protein n=1 Tax=Victivallis vadensis TaxID=172901 RepID=UPI003B8A6EC3